VQEALGTAGRGDEPRDGRRQASGAARPAGRAVGLAVGLAVDRGDARGWWSSHGLVGQERRASPLTRPHDLALHPPSLTPAPDRLARDRRLSGIRVEWLNAAQGPGTAPGVGGGHVELSVTSRQEGARTVISVGGEIDVYTAPSLRERLNELVASGHYDLVVDMEQVEFLDSTGLGVLVGGLKRVRSYDGTLSLVCSQEKILKVFRITGLTKVFPIYASLQEALEDTSGVPDGTAS
jgi:anti-sigma B factor antagonist